jgi:uncharacterized protein (TIGR03067 family)
MDPIPGLPTALAVVLTKMTAKDPADRYQSADEVVAALERCLRVVDRARERRQVRGLWAGLAAAGLVVLTGLLVAVAVIKVAATLIQIQRDNQVITVATNDDDIEVVMKRKGEVLRIIDKKTGQEWAIDTEKNEIAWADTPGGLALGIPEKDGIVLKRNGKAVFTVTRTPRPAPAVARPDSTPPVAPRLVQTVQEDRRFPQTPAFTPDGKALLVAGFDYFAIYDPATGKELFSDKFGRAETYTHLAVSADGRTAAVACGDVYLYDLAARKRMATLAGPEVDGKLFAVTALTLSPDGQTLAYVAGREVVYYDRSTGQTEHTRPDDDKVRVFDVRHSPDGRYLAVASHVEADQSTRISLLDGKTRELVGRHQTTFRSGATLQFSRDGQQLFVAGRDILRRTFLVLGVPGAREVEQDPDLPSGPEAPVPSPDGRLLALTGSDGTVQVWDRGQKRATFSWNPHPQTPPEFRPPPGHKAAPPRTGIAFSPDGRTLATARGDQIRVWELVPDAPKTDLHRIEGTWLAVSGEHAGNPWDSAAVKMTQFAFNGELFRFTFPFPEDILNQKIADKPATTTGTFTLDPTKVPGVITLIGEEGENVLVQGIYRLDGERLTLCLGRPGHDRPRDFKAPAGGENTLLVLRRGTPDEVILADIERRIDPASTDGTSLPFALLERNGVAAVRFGKWLVVFEGVRCDAGGKVLFGVGSFFLPETGGRGNFVDPGLKRPAPAIRQQSTGRGDMIGLERYEFKMEAKGARLVFTDKTYEATDKVQTIVVAADGTTRVEKAPK